MVHLKRQLLFPLLVLAMAGCGTSSPPPVTNPSYQEAASSQPPSDTYSLPSDSDTNDTQDPKQQNPYAGLKVENVSLFQQVETLIADIRRDSTQVVARASQRRDIAISLVRLGQLKISLDQSASQRFRETVTRLHLLEDRITNYSLSIDKLNPHGSRDHLAHLYDSALDSGNNLSPDIRHRLSQFLRSNRPSIPRSDSMGASTPHVDFQPALPYRLQEHSLTLAYRVDVASLLTTIRTQLLDDTLRGDDIFASALAIHERGMVVKSMRAWTKSYSDLVRALPPDLQFAHMFYFYSSIPRSSAYTAETANRILDRSLTLNTQQLDELETPFTKCDSEGWDLLIALDDLLTELRQLLRACSPDFPYTFDYLVPPNRSRSPAANALPRLDILSAIQARTPGGTSAHETPARNR